MAKKPKSTPKRKRNFSVIDPTSPSRYFSSQRDQIMMRRLTRRNKNADDKVQRVYDLDTAVENPAPLPASSLPTHNDGATEEQVPIVTPTKSSIKHKEQPADESPTKTSSNLFSQIHSPNTNTNTKNAHQHTSTCEQKKPPKDHDPKDETQHQEHHQVNETLPVPKDTGTTATPQQSKKHQKIQSTGDELNTNQRPAIGFKTTGLVEDADLQDSESGEDDDSTINPIPNKKQKTKQTEPTTVADFFLEEAEESSGDEGVIMASSHEKSHGNNTKNASNNDATAATTPLGINVLQDAEIISKPFPQLPLLYNEDNIPKVPQHRLMTVMPLCNAIIVLFFLPKSFERSPPVDWTFFKIRECHAMDGFMEKAKMTRICGMRDPKNPMGPALKTGRNGELQHEAWKVAIQLKPPTKPVTLKKAKKFGTTLAALLTESSTYTKWPQKFGYAGDITPPTRYPLCYYICVQDVLECLRILHPDANHPSTLLNRDDMHLYFDQDTLLKTKKLVEQGQGAATSWNFYDPQNNHAAAAETMRSLGMHN